MQVQRYRSYRQPAFYLVHSNQSVPIADKVTRTTWFLNGNNKQFGEKKNSFKKVNNTF